MRPEDVKPGVKVRHYRGGEYRIILRGIIESSGTLAVVYQPLDLANYECYWIRPLTEGENPFCGEASPGVERFTVIPEDQP